MVAVVPGGPADMRGLLEGDVLIEVAFRRIMSQAPGKIIAAVDDPKRENVNVKVATLAQVQVRCLLSFLSSCLLLLPSL